MKMNTELIRMFGVALEGNTVDATVINMEALKRGYIVHPACSTQVVMDFLREETIDYNATFYNDWKDVTDKSRFDLFVDQCVHYFASYELNINLNANDGDRKTVPMYQGYKYIQPISSVDLYDKCMDMLGTNVALKQTSVTALVEYVCEYVKKHSIDFDIDLVANKEAVGMICSKLGILPNDPFQLLRHIMFVTTGSSMLIKDKNTINKIKTSINPFDFTTLNEKQLKALASIFYRFKPIFLAFRKDIWKNYKGWMSDHTKLIQSKFGYNRVIINKIRRMADKYHTPLRTGFWEEILGNDCPVEYVRKVLNGNTFIEAPSNFKLIQLIQSINDWILTACGRGKRLYIIRNGKTWVKESDMNVIDSRIFRLEDLRNLFENELVKRLSKYRCVVKFPKDIELACPTSEKNFVGDLPLGSYFPMTKNSFFGIYWKNDWGTRDFDLSFIDNAGNKIGWNSGFYTKNNDVVYSGDITNAPNGAAEVILCKKDCPDGIININRYNGNNGSKYRLFFGTGDENTYNFTGSGYMVNPNHIKVQTDCISDSGQQAIGLTYNNKAYVMTLGTSGGAVSMNNSDIREALHRKVDTFIYVKDLLLKAGFEDYDNIDKSLPENEDLEVELDLTCLKRDTLIELFS